MYVRVLLNFIVLISLPFDYCTDYYLKIGGTDSTSCTSYSNACGTLDYIITPLLNNTNGIHNVYIDTDTHNIALVSYVSVDSTSGPFLPLINVIFTLTPYLSSSSFSSSDVDTYPVILTNKSTEQVSPFFLYANISSSFHYLKFLIGNNSNNERYFIMSFCFYLFFIYIYIL
jgi:hypothetical protein